MASDHGQLLGEHGLFGHAQFPYEELTIVPFGSTEEEPDGEGWISIRQVGRLLTDKKVERRRTEYAEFCGIWPYCECIEKLEPRHYIAIADGNKYGVVEVNSMKTVYGEVDKGKAKRFLRTLKLTRKGVSVKKKETH